MEKLHGCHYMQLMSAMKTWATWTIENSINIGTKLYNSESLDYVTQKDMLKT